MEWLFDFLKLIFNENAIPAVMGFFSGLVVGNIVSKHMWNFVSELIRFRREDRLRKEQESKAKQEEDARQEARKAFYRECARLGLMIEEDVCCSTDGVAYCTECYDRKKIVELVKNRTRKALYCPECGFVLDLSHEC